MTDLLELREKAEVEIRSLLLSTPIGLTAKQLRDDYHSFVGKTLPYRELGFYGVEDMVRDMPNVVRVNWQNGQMILKAVSNEHTERIAQLVSKQRVSKKDTREQNRRRTGGASSYGRNAPRFSRRPDPGPMVPAYLRNQVVELLKCYRGRIRLSQLTSAFAKRFGVQLDWRHMGFKSLYDLMQYLNNRFVVTMEKEGPTDYMVYSGGGGGSGYKSSQTYNPAYRNASQDNSMYAQGRQRDLGHLPSQTQCVKGVVPKIIAVQPEERREDEVLIAAEGRKSSTPPRGHSYLDELDESDGSGSEPDLEDSIHPVMKREILQLLASKPDGVMASRLIQEYKVLYQKELVLTELGYYSVLQLVEDLQDIVRVERASRSDWRLFDARIPAKAKSPPPEEQLEEEQKPITGTQKFDETFKEEVRWVLLRSKDGLLHHELADVYHRHTGKVLDLKELGFDTIVNMLLSMDKYLTLKYVGEGNLRVSAIEFPADVLTDPTDLPPVVESPPMPLPISTPVKSKYPSDIVAYGASYKPLSLAHLHPRTATQEYFEVVVSNINNPSRFWLQLRGPKTSFALEDLMEELDFYKTPAGDAYIMPESMVSVGQVCAVIFPEDGNWHRGVIVGMKDIDFVQVYYVDYGNTCSVEKTSLRMLRTKYVQLPCQAIQARLTNLAPPPQGWSTSTLARMLELVGNKPVIASVTDLKKCVLSVCLVDTSTAEDIHVNQLLCTEGYATYCPDNPPITDSQVTLSSGSSGENVTTGEADLPPRPRYVKPVVLTDEFTVHLVNFNSKPYLLSAEISAFFWSIDMLRNVLRQKKLDLSREVISHKEYPALFEELILHNVRGMMDGNSPRLCVTLYELSGVILILDHLEHPSADLKSAVQDVVNTFDPDDAYWTPQLIASEEASGVSYNDTAATDTETPAFDRVSVDTTEPEELGLSSSAKFEDLSFDDLVITRDVLQINRKRLLQRVIREPGDPKIVDELYLIEMDIIWLQARIRKLSANKETASSEAEPRPTACEPAVLSSLPAANTLTPDHVQTYSPSKSKVTPIQVVNPTNMTKLTPLADTSASSQVPPATSAGSSGSAFVGSTANTSQQTLLQNLQYQGLLLMPPMNVLNQTVLGFGVDPSLIALPGNAAMTSPSRQDSLTAATQRLTQLQQQQQQLLNQQQLHVNLAQQQQQLAQAQSQSCSTPQQQQRLLNQQQLNLAQQQQQLAQAQSQSCSTPQQQQQQLFAPLSPSSLLPQAPAEGRLPVVVDQLPPLDQLYTSGQATDNMLGIALLSDLLPLLNLGRGPSNPPS